jgi:D-alanyl-D-alanine carboxypeptidase
MKKLGLVGSSLPAALCVAIMALLIGCAPAPDEAAKGDPTDELAARFQAELDRIHQEAESTDESFPGATAAFILQDGRVFGFATGLSDIEENIPMAADMRMPSGSIGKTYTAAVGLSLHVDGVLDLDEKISRWMGEEPWFDRLPNGNDITLRMLLNHSAGLVDHVFDVEEFHEAARTVFGSGDPEAYLGPRELLEFALDREPLFPAGEAFKYTDTGYILAGMVMEKASGSSYYAELTRRFLEPLGLELTLPQDRRRVPNLSQGYAVQSAALFGVPPKVVEDGALVFNPLIEWTGGGLFNNPQDLVRWASALYGGSAMDGPYLDDLLGSVAPAGPEPVDVSYGLGVGIYQTPFGQAYGHSGFFPGYLSTLRYFPDHGIAVAMQMNTDAEQPSRMDSLVQVVIEGIPRLSAE